jgi:hypothetical protein
LLSQRLLRLNSNADPWKSLVPERVTAVTMPPGAAAVFGAVVVDQHLELADGVDAEQAAGGAARGPVALRVGVGPVELIADLVRARAGDRHLRAHAAIDLLLRAGRGGDAELPAASAG